MTEKQLDELAGLGDSLSSANSKFGALLARLLKEREMLIVCLKRLNQYHGGEWTTLETEMIGAAIEYAEKP